MLVILDRVLGMELLGHIISLCFIFKEISILFSKQTCFRRESKFVYDVCSWLVFIFL